MDVSQFFGLENAYNNGKKGTSFWDIPKEKYTCVYIYIYIYIHAYIHACIHTYESTFSVWESLGSPYFPTFPSSYTAILPLVWAPFLALPGAFWVGLPTKEIWYSRISKLTTTYNVKKITYAYRKHTNPTTDPVLFSNVMLGHGKWTIHGAFDIRIVRFLGRETVSVKIRKQKKCLSARFFSQFVV